MMTAQAFYSLTAGYWQTDDMPEQDYLDAYPEDTIQVPLRPTPYHLWEGGGDGNWVEGPVEPAPPVVKILYPVDLWSRLTDEEADQVDAAMATQSVRVLNIFRTASSYRSDHDLWTLLESTAITLFGATRAAEILAPSAGT